MKTVVLGLGNPILRDDGAGIEVIKLLEGKLAADCELKMASVGGLRILDQICGFERAIIVDALLNGAPAGTVRKMGPDDLAGDLHASCVHDLNFKEALQLGRMMGMPLPQEITIYGIEVADPFQLREGCSPDVLSGAKKAARLIREDLETK